MAGYGWLSRAFEANAIGKAYSADFVSIASNESGSGQGGARAINLAAAQAFVNQARLAKTNGLTLPEALSHIAKIDRDIVSVTVTIDPKMSLKPSSQPAWLRVCGQPLRCCHPVPRRFAHYPRG